MNSNKEETKTVTVRLPVDVHRKLKVLVAQQGMTCQDYITTAIYKAMKEDGVSGENG